MASIIFWILFWLLIAVLIISSFLREKEKDNRRKEKIRSFFGKRDTIPEDCSFLLNQSEFMAYYGKCHPADQYIDDITTRDLQLHDIYSRLDRCMSPAGRDCLYALLRFIPHEESVSAIRYEKIHQYINNKDKAVDHAYILSRLGHRNNTDVFVLISGLEHAKQRNIMIDISMMVLIIAGIILSLFIPAAGIALTVIMLVISVITYFSGKRVMDENLKGLAMCLQLIACAEKLNAAGCEDFDQYRELFSLLSAKCLIPYRESTTSSPFAILYDYIRIITHIDLIVYSIKIKKIISAIETIRRMYVDIGMVDSHISLASYIYERDHCLAVFTQESILSAKGMYHPLVEDPVCNDINANRGVMITGSNASGKSTFLKAVGVNEIFAACLGFAFASEFVSGRFSIYTSMALTDDLLAKESYYVAEARSIKRICDAAREGKCLCIIDEILKGTNTTERIAASTQVLRYLCKKDILCFAATHDRELTVLLNDEMDQYHFSEEIENDTVRFPFLIKKGVADKTNAITILSMLGFDESIVSSADDLADRYRRTGKWEIKE